MQEIDREDYDELKAYKIISDMYEAQKKELVNLEKKLKDSQAKLKKTEESIRMMNEMENSDLNIFSPKKNGEQNKNEIRNQENRKRDVEKHIDFIHERILKTRELVAEFSFVMNTLRDKNVETENQIKCNDDFLNDLTDKILFCKEIVMFDPMRVREELDAIYKILVQLK